MKDFYEIKIEKMTLGGRGIGYIDGKVCFVHGSIPGEIVKVAITKEKKDYSVGRILEIINPSSYRVTPKCPIFNECGGCHLQHISYSHQIDLKKTIFLDTLTHIGKMQKDINDFIYKDEWYYRSRTQLPVQNKKDLKIGYFKTGTHRVVNQESCLINHQLINGTLSIVRKRIKKSNVSIYDEITHRGNLRHIIIKVGINTRQVFITFVTKDRYLPKNLYEGLNKEIENLVGVSQNVNSERTNRILGTENHNIFGQQFLEEKIGGKLFRIGAASFFQINIPVFEEILEDIKKEIALYGNGILLDLYAGVGAIGICVAENVRSVIAIEENLCAVKDGLNNANINHINNFKFIHGNAEEKLKLIKEADIAILDPPRKGASPEILDYLKKLKIKEIVYLSCNPSTFARDAHYLINNNFQIKKMMLFDMFPQTYHIESLTFFERHSPDVPNV